MAKIPEPLNFSVTARGFFPSMKLTSALAVEFLRRQEQKTHVIWVRHLN